jgi:hypothetical protein
MTVETMTSLSAGFLLLSISWMLSLGMILALSRHSKLRVQVIPASITIAGAAFLIATLIAPYLGFWLTSEVAHSWTAIYTGVSFTVLLSITGATVPLWWLTDRPVRALLTACGGLVVIAAGVVLLVYVRLAVAGAWAVMLDTLTALAVVTMMFLMYVMLRVSKHERQL